MSTNRHTVRFAVSLVSVVLFLSSILLAHGDQQHVMGTVTQIEAGSVSVKTTSGEVKVVTILSTTKFLKGTAAVTLQDLKVGDRVVIHAKPQGNVLNATEVKIGEAKDSMQHN